MDARTEMLEKAKDVKLRVKVESPEVQEALKKLGYHERKGNLVKYIAGKDSRGRPSSNYIVILPTGQIKLEDHPAFRSAEQRYQVELYLLIITGLTTFE